MASDRRYMQAGGAAMAEQSELMMLLGRLQEGVEHLRKDFDEERVSAATSRRLIYEKHDEMVRDLSQLKQDIEVGAIISAQGREDVKRLGEAIDAHKAAIQPSIEDWNRIKMLGLGITGILALGGLSVGALVMMGVDAFRAALRHWLGG